MYHISNDKRAERSAEALYQGLLDCLERQSYTDVTVRDLSVASGISRATFYRLFDNITDILFWKSETILVSSMMQANAAGIQSLSIAIQHFVSAWMDNHRLLETLVRCNRTEILHEVHGKHMDDFREVFLADMEISAVQADYLSFILTAMLPAAFQAWLLNSEGPEVLVMRVQECLELLNKMFHSV